MRLLNRITIFLLITACVWVLLLWFMPSAHQESLFFCSAQRLHFMDYFMPRRVFSMPQPYEVSGISTYVGHVPRVDQCYPALVVLWTGCFAESMAGALVFQLIGSIVYFLGVALVLRKYGITSILAIAVMLLSAPFLFTVEVGNPILYAAGAALIYLAWYDSGRRSCRMAAAVALAVSAVFKITPMLLGLLYLRSRPKRDWWGAISAGGIFLVLLLVPFMFLGGYEAFVAWVANARLNASLLEYSMRNAFGLYGLVAELIRVVGYPGEVLPIIHIPLRLLSSALGLLLAFCSLLRSDDEFVQVCLLVLGMLFIPSTMMSYTVLYAVPLFIVGTVRYKGSMARVFGLCWVLSCMPLQIPLLLGSTNACFSAAAMLDLSCRLLCNVPSIRRRLDGRRNSP